MPTKSGVHAFVAGERNAAGPVAHIAVVHGPSEVYFVVAGDSRKEMLYRLAARLDEEAHVQLWTEDAARFRSLLAGGRIKEAVDFYFSTVGSRWDPAQLSVHLLPE